MTPLACIFPSEAEALLVARFISGNPDAMGLPADGWVTDEATGERYYYNIAAFGTLYWPNEGPVDLDDLPDLVPYGYEDPETGAVTEGYCLIGLWSGDFESLPFPLHAFMVDSLPVVFG